ncbi:MAG: hypothetical protein ACRCRT_03820, partial [Cetobacterium somerae]
NGEGFYNSIDNTGDVLIPVGTNGTEKTTGGQARPYEMGQFWKGILNNEGSLIKSGGTDPKTGKPLMKRNPYADALNKEQKTVCAEFLSTAGSGVSVNRLFPILAKSSLDYTEGDVNSYSMTMMRGCDMSERTGYYWETVETPPANTTDMLTEFEVDYIIVAGGSEPSSGVENGALSANVDADGKITFKKYTGSVWEEEATLVARLQYGTRIMARTLVKTDTVVGNHFIIVNTATKTEATAVNFSTDEAVKQFYVEVLLFNRDNCVYELYCTPDGISIKRPQTA